MPLPTDKIVAVYTGSFDPVTLGHLDIIARASLLFNELVVGVGRNPEKTPLFSADERLRLIEPHLKAHKNVRAEAYDDLTIDFARRSGARALIRGIRDLADFSHELQQANVNRVIGDVETVFLLASDIHTVTSSTYIRQIFELGGGGRQQVERLVPPNVVNALRKKFGLPRRP